MRVVEQNKAIVVTPNVAAIVYGAVAVLNPLAGVIINNGVAMIAALDSLRPLNIAQRQVAHQAAQQAAGGDADAPTHQDTPQAQFAA